MGLIQQIGVFQHILVTVEEVNTDTHVEDKVGEVELVLNITCIISRSVRGDVAVLGVGGVVEVSQAPVAAIIFSTGMVITIVADNGRTIVEQLVRSKHVNTASLDEDFGVVAVDVNPRLSGDTFVAVTDKIVAELLVEIGLTGIVDQSVIIDIQGGTHPAVMRIGEVELLDMCVGIVAHQLPQSGGSDCISRLVHTVVLETNFQGMAFDFGASLGTKVDIVDLRIAEGGSLNTHIVKQAIHTRRNVTISKALIITKDVDVGDGRGNLGDA